MMTTLPRATIVALLLLAALASGPRAAETDPEFRPGRLSFEAQIGDERNPYEVMVFSVLPGHSLSIAVPAAPSGARFALKAPAGVIAESGTAAWTWTAPGLQGLHPLRLTRFLTGEVMTLNTFVVVPMGEVRDGELEGHRIGEHPRVPLRDLPIYKPPRGFIRITPEIQDTRVSPRFRLRQFLCKQEGGFPKFLVLRSRLLLKLEHLLQLVNEAGHRADTFFVMSGYRTPFYNRAIGNVKYSRHLWGGAADVFIDQSPRDGMMDDLNGDDAIDWKDAAVLYNLFDGQYGKGAYKPFVGGLGRYGRTASHGPFVHVDVRGFRARWGT